MSSVATLHMFVPVRHIGALENPSNRGKIEHTTSTEIKLLDQNAYAERLVAICGHVVHVRNAVTLILGLYGEEVHFKLPVAKNQMGALIGKQGCIIKSIREQAGCVVQAYSDKESVIYAPDRVMSLQGPQTKVAVAILRCLDLLMAASATNGKPASPQTSNSTMKPPERRMSIMSTGPSTPLASILSQSPGRGIKRPAPLSPGKSTPVGAPNLSLPIMQIVEKRPRVVHVQDSTVEIPSQVVVKIPFTGAQAGIVIGQKGSTIKQIRGLSGARVNIDSPNEAQARNSTPDVAKRDMREMTCIGTVAQCEAALNLIRQCFKHHESPMSGKVPGLVSPHDKPPQPPAPAHMSPGLTTHDTQPQPPLTSPPHHIPYPQTRTSTGSLPQTTTIPLAVDPLPRASFGRTSTASLHESPSFLAHAQSSTSASTAHSSPLAHAFSRPIADPLSPQSFAKSSPHAEVIESSPWRQVEARV